MGNISLYNWTMNIFLHEKKWTVTSLFLINECIRSKSQTYLSKLQDVYCIIEQWIFLFARQRMRGIFRPLCSECRLPLPNAPFSPIHETIQPSSMNFSDCEICLFYKKNLLFIINPHNITTILQNIPCNLIHQTIQPSFMIFSDCDICIFLWNFQQGNWSEKSAQKQQGSVNFCSPQFQLHPWHEFSKLSHLYIFLTFQARQL